MSQSPNRLRNYLNVSSGTLNLTIPIPIPRLNLKRWLENFAHPFPDFYRGGGSKVRYLTSIFDPNRLRCALVWKWSNIIWKLKMLRKRRWLPFTCLPSKFVMIRCTQLGELNFGISPSPPPKKKNESVKFAKSSITQPRYIPSIVLKFYTLVHYGALKVAELLKFTYAVISNMTDNPQILSV